ncbi:MAG TPA: protein kinase [Candidatus Acidoferrum sp.]|nr:protein kinase [Candidatus Acidoferrum sp.]
MALTNGTKLGPYEIVAPLGAGGMGEVYRARDTRLDRSVAIKILPAHFSSDPVRKQRFEREAKTISSLNHPHICVLHDIGSQDGIDFLVMECVEGETLAKRLEKGALPLEQVLKYGAQIADALDKAHRSGVVHRDLKPGNIMLTPTGAKLLDFGLAKPAAPLASVATLTAAVTQSSPMTEQGAIVGTFQYMSPEQVEGKEVDARSDIFSFGAMLYEMVTGRRAFPGKSQLSVASAILEKEPEPISAVKPMTPPALDHAVKKCLAKIPDERWQSASDMASELKWIAESGSHIGGVSARQKSERGRRGWVTAGIALAALFAGLGVAYFWRPTPDRRVIRSSILPPEKSSFAESANDWASVAVSPDGSRIVVGVVGQAGPEMLYVRPLDALTGQVLAGTEGASFPFWSPNGHSIGFFADGQLKTIDASGGPVQVLCPGPEGRGGTWNRDGLIVFAPSPFASLFRVAATGGAPVAVTKLDTARHEDTHRWPQFLPDGRHFLYLARTTDITTSEIHLGSIDSVEPVSVLGATGNPVYAPPGLLLYPRGDILVAQPFDADRFRVSGESVPIADQVSWNGNVNHSAFSVSTNGVLAYTRAVGKGVSELIWMDRNGKILGKVGEPGLYFGPSLSPDGRKLAVEIYDTHTSTNSDIWIYDLTQGSRTRLTFSQPNEQNRLPVWSPDGNRIVFSSDRGGHSQIYEKSVSGVGAENVVSPSEGHRYATTWSADGQFIAGFQENPQHGSLQFLVLSRPAGDKTIPFLSGISGLSRFTFPRISPNGKWIAYVSWESGRGEVYISSFPSGAGKWQVSANGGNSPAWRHDGKELFYIVGSNDTMTAVEISERKESPVVGKIHPLFRTRRVPSPSWPYDVSADGNLFLINSVLQSAVPEPITLVLNWDAELRKK